MIYLKTNSINGNIAFKSAKNPAKLKNPIEKIIKEKHLAPAIVLSGLAALGITNVNPLKLREQAKRYNEKDDKIQSSVDNVMKKIKELESSYDAKKSGEDSDKPKLPFSKELEERRLPDFSREVEFDDDFYEGLNRIDYTHIDKDNFEKEASIIKNKYIKEIAAKILGQDQLTKSLFNYLRDVDAGLENINDHRILRLRHEIMHLNEPSIFAKYTADPELARLYNEKRASEPNPVTNLLNAIFGINRK